MGKPETTKTLTQKRLSFCHAYVSNGSKREAYLSTFASEGLKDSQINARASALLKDPVIAAYIEQLRSEARERCEITIDSLTAMYLEDRKFARECGQPAACIAAVTHIAKLHGLYTEKAKVSIERQFADMSEEELRAYVQAKMPMITGG